MNKTFFNIDDFVYCPRHKLSGHIVDKYMFRYMYDSVVYYLARVDNSVYGDSSFHVHLLYLNIIDGLKMKTVDLIFVRYDMLKSTNPSNMYKSIKSIKPKHFMDVTDIKYGNVVKFIDNNYFERIINKEIRLYHHSLLRITTKLKSKLYLTGEIINQDGMDYVECITGLNIRYANTFYYPIDCLKIIKRVSKLKYFWYKLMKRF